MLSVSDHRPTPGRRVAVLSSLVLIVSGCSNSPRSLDADPGTIVMDEPTTVFQLPGEASTTSSTDSTTIAPVIASSTLVAGPGTIRHPAGLVLSYPEGWHETGTVISTQFAAEALCVAARIVDQAPPSDPAQAGFVLQSGVQVCSLPGDGASLDAYMESVYGTGVPGFARAEIGGLAAFRHDVGLQSLIFTQTDSYRIQVATFVAADPDVEGTRLAQVQQILDSARFS